MKFKLVVYYVFQVNIKMTQALRRAKVVPWEHIVVVQIKHVKIVQ